MAIEVTTFGGFDIRANGESVFEQGSRTSKNLELLKYFITYHDQRLVPEKIIESLWPEEELANPLNALRTQIFRLRKNLSKIGLTHDGDGESHLEIVFDNGFYVLLVGDGCVIDTDLYASAIKEADCRRETDPHEAEEIYKKVVSLYKGEYLAEDPFCEWVFTIRSRFHRQYLQSVLRLLQLLKSKEAYGEILDIYEQAIVHEPFEESLHVHFLEALVSLGDYKTASSHYSYITGKMFREMSIRPTPALKSVYREIAAAGEENETTSLVQVKKEFTVDDVLEGALYCDIEHFKIIYNLERRKTLRTGNATFLGLITIDKNEGVLSGEETKKSFEVLKGVLLCSLRRGDVFSRLRPAQMVLILTDLVEANLQLITKRINKRFRDRLVSDKIHLKTSFQPIGDGVIFIS